MSAVWAWVRVDVRGRWRSLAVLALLVALTTAVVVTAVAGSRRGATVVDRLLERTLPATIAALPNEAGFDWNAVAQIPGVEALARFPVAAYEVEGFVSDEVADFAYMDESIMREVERPVVLDGRLTDPARDDEVVITRGFESTFDRGVGDTVTITLYSPEQVDEYLSTNDVGPPEGPEIESRIVGIVRSPWFSDSQGTGGGRLIPSSGLFAQHPANLLGSEELVSVNALIRLEGGMAAVPAFRERLAEVSGRPDIDLMHLASDAGHVRDVTGFEANALLAFAIAALIAALFLVGQSVARFVSAARSDLLQLVAIGMAPAHARSAAIVGPLGAATVGAGLGVGVAYAVSARFPTGTAKPFEPSPGRSADVVVIVAALILVPALVAAGAWLAAWLSTRPMAVLRPERPSAIAALAGRLGAPIPVSIGTRFALERGRGSQAVPVYPALVGAVVGVVGVVAALTFSAGVSDAAAHPERFGQVADLEAFVGFNGEDFLPADDVAEVIAADPNVLAVNDTRQAVAGVGDVNVPAFVIDPVDRPVPLIVTEGREPSGPDEVLLAPGSAGALGVDLGDTVELVGTRAARTMTVSGLAFVPEGSHNSYDVGAWVPVVAFDELFAGFKFHVVSVALRAGTDPDEAAARIGAAVADALGAPPEMAEGLLGPLPPPPRLAELKQVQQLPRYLAAFLALLAVGAVGHAVATAVRRRRHDLAVLRAVGVTRGQSRVTVLVQATVLAAVGLVVGVPVGFALGRSLWRTVADSTPVDHVPPLDVWVLVLIGPASLLAATLLAAWPSQRAASLRVAQVLRTE